MLDTELFDLLVIGGGINGTGIARHAAGRGLCVALVEETDLPDPVREPPTHRSRCPRSIGLPDSRGSGRDGARLWNSSAGIARRWIAGLVKNWQAEKRWHI